MSAIIFESISKFYSAEKCGIRKNEIFRLCFCPIWVFDVAAAAKKQIQSELGGVSHQIFKKNISKKLKLYCKLQVKLESAKREMFVKSKKNFFFWDFYT